MGKSVVNVVISIVSGALAFLLGICLVCVAVLIAIFDDTKE